ncbi:MAG: hypothetical protein GY810_08580 [Aureispira sp.]|nr:hypothetical protein [Aureispira sp.]
MKTYTLIVLFIACFGLLACNPSSSNSTNSTETVADTSSNSREVVDPNKQVDPRPAVSDIVKLGAKLRTELAKLDKSEAKWLEEQPLHTFCGRDIEMGSLTIFQTTLEGGTVTEVLAEYFDGAPMGNKRFIAYNQKLLLVDIVKLEEVEEDGKTAIQETISHSFYYEEGNLQEVQDGNAEELDKGVVEGLTWLDENMEQWNTVIKKATQTVESASK